jgi:hypothetical protein
VLREISIGGLVANGPLTSNNCPDEQSQAEDWHDHGLYHKKIT